jgi:hypothetical protein
MAAYDLDIMPFVTSYSKAAIGVINLVGSTHTSSGSTEEEEVAKCTTMVADGLILDCRRSHAP